MEEIREAIERAKASDSLCLQLRHERRAAPQVRVRFEARFISDRHHDRALHP